MSNALNFKCYASRVKTTISINVAKVSYIK